MSSHVDWTRVSIDQVNTIGMIREVDFKTMPPATQVYVMRAKHWRHATNMPMWVNDAASFG